MKITKWLERKYPNYHKIISLIFSEHEIEKWIKDSKYQLAVLIKNVGIYKTGTLFLVKKSGHIEENGWDGTYDIYGLFNCGTEITESGYNHVFMPEDSYYIIKEAETK